jgi:hypothetical protein
VVNVGLIVVTGPPASGKTSWVASRARATDVVIDLDAIARALSGPGADSHDHAPVPLKVAHRARFAAIDEALRHLPDVDVYLIHSQPNEKATARYRRHRARIVTVDPGRDVVMERVRTMRRPGVAGAVTRWYSQAAKRGESQGVIRQSARRW